MEIAVRLATAEDHQTVQLFDATDHLTAFQRREGGTFISGLIASESAYLVFADDMPAGYARIDYLWPERIPLLSWIYVVDEFRSHGLANRLREHIFSLLREKGYEAVLRSACSARPGMVAKLAAQCQPAGQLTFLNGSSEYFFWHRFNDIAAS